MTTIKLTKDNFTNEVINSSEPVLVDFFASWCGPCKMVSPVVDSIAEEAKGFKVGKINVDEQQALAAEYGVMTIPTLIVFKDGKEAGRSVGFKPKAQILSMLA